MMKMKRTKYYSFQEVIDLLALQYPIEDVNYPSQPNSANTSDNWFSKTVNELGLKLDLVGFKASSTIIPSNVIENFIDALIRNVYDRHNKDYIAEVHHDYYGYDDENLDLEEAKDLAFNKLINVINLTAPRYIPIMVSYVNNYEEPIKMLESISESFSRYNDTPQNEQDEVDYNTPDYATNMGKNKNVSKIDSGSVIERLKSLTESFRSIILDWSNEFNQLFLNDLQLEY